eukprot:COSAG02_NODE_1819_length_10773_cov_6.699550_5_plen_455_part_00
MQKELTEQQKQAETLQSLLDAEQPRREAAEREVSRMTGQIEQREKEMAELQTRLETSKVSQSETEDKLSGARAMIQDLEHQLADLRAFSGRGRGGDLGSVVDLEQEVSLRKAAEAECERLRQELAHVASPGPTATANTSGDSIGDQSSSISTESVAATIEPRGLQRQSTGSHGLSQVVGTESAVTEELQALRADMQLLLQQQRSQDENSTKTQREPQDSQNEEESKQLHRPQQSQLQSSGNFVDEQWRSVPSAPASDCNSIADFSDGDCGAEGTNVAQAGIAPLLARPEQDESADGHCNTVSRAVELSEPTIALRRPPCDPRDTTLGDSATDAAAAAAATARSVQSRQEVEHILNALEAARRSLDLSATDGPGGLRSAHAMPSASRPDFVSRSAPSTPAAAVSTRRSFGQLCEDEDVQMDRFGPRDEMREPARLGPRRNPMLSLAGHNNRYSMY